MKIAHIIFSYNTGGSETMLSDIINHQIHHSNITLFIINNQFDINLIKKLDKRINVSFINRTEGSKNIIPIIKLNLKLKKYNPDVIHCHHHNIAEILLPIYRNKMHLTVHDVGIPTKYYNKFRKLFAISEAVKNDISSRSEYNSEIIYNGINTQTITTKDNYNISNNFRIVQISRLNHEKKGQHLIIEALRKLKNIYNNINITLDLIGEGDSKEYLHKMIEDYGLTNNVQMLGLKDREYIYQNLCQYDLLIQPSLYEGFGLTIVEAMAAKIPVLVSDIQGPIEIIEHGKYGYYFKSNNVDDLTYNILGIIKEYNSQKMLEMINNAFNIANRKYSIEKTVSNYMNSYAC